MTSVIELLEKKCSKCKQVLPTTDFCKDRGQVDGLDRWCKSCRKTLRQNIRGKVKESHSKLREDNREYLNQRKTPCLKCGENRPYVIHYHHIDHATKEFTLGHKMTYSKDHLDREIEKCVCLCANCHTEFHHIYGQNPTEPRKCLEEYLGDLWSV